MKDYLNTITGEIITAKSKRVAVRYFKADGKVFGYKVKKNNVVELDPYGNIILVIRRNGTIAVA